jgi:hypothetical protein
MHFYAIWPRYSHALWGVLDARFVGLVEQICVRTCAACRQQCDNLTLSLLNLLYSLIYLLEMSDELVNNARIIHRAEASNESEVGQSYTTFLTHALIRS